MNLIPPDELEGAEIRPFEFPITDTKPLWDICEQLISACNEFGGIGLAAPQVGIFKRIAVCKFSDGFYVPIINPRYFATGSRTNSREGCLSYPGEAYWIKRAKSIHAQYYTMETGGRNLHYVERKSYSGLDAIIFQHETDHCNGVTVSMKGKSIGPIPPIGGVEI